MKRLIILPLIIFSGCRINEIKAQEKPGSSAEELAKKLSNPVASLISTTLATRSYPV